MSGRGRFPERFLLGVATSAYQIEGAVREDGRGESIWDTLCRVPGAIANGDSGEVAADFYHRHEEDLEQMARLGIQSFRFSIAWPRVFPRGLGDPNPRGIAFYRGLVDALCARGIVPIVTLNHWDLPQALQDAGGWKSRATIAAFVRFAETMFDALADAVPLWITHNEPWMIAFAGYLRGVHAPGVTGDLEGALRTAHHLLVAHGLAVGAYRRRAPAGQIGIALNLFPTYPRTSDERDVAAARLSDGYTNRWFLDPLHTGAYPADAQAHFEALLGHPLGFVEPGDLAVAAERADFLGVNYYQRRVIEATPGEDLGWRVCPADPATPVTDAGWEITPAAFTELLVRLQRDYGVPIYITENGAIFDDVVAADGGVHDPRRIDFLRQHLRAVLAALAAGVDVRGYSVWSLIDNFEWAKGYDWRFGVVYVDFATQRRIPKDSAGWLRSVIAARDPDVAAADPAAAG